MSSARIHKKSLNLEFKELPRIFDGLKFIYLSDLHFVGRVRGLEREVARIIEEESAEAVILGGDMINHRKAWNVFVSYLLDIKTPSKRWCVPGNWEYRRGGGLREYRKEMQRAGFIDLCNGSAQVTRGSETIHFVGLDDPRHGEPDLKKAMRGVDGFVVGVCHSPDILLELKDSPFPILLCGHTHGGQICLPGIGPVFTSTRIGRKFAFGLHRLAAERYMYVTRGLGCGVPNIRIGSPSEVVVITLKTSTDDGHRGE